MRRIGLRSPRIGTAGRSISTTARISWGFTGIVIFILLLLLSCSVSFAWQWISSCDAATSLPCELYLVAFCATALLPENIRLSLYDGWIGLLGSRLTTISAIFGLCFLGYLKPRKWQLAGFTVCAIVFFAFLYQDTGWLNRLEANAEKLVANLPPGTRVIVSTQAPEDSRITFIGHAVERACIGHCFSYANYEPASGQFRVRVRKGSPVAASSTDDAEDMASGQFEFDDLGFALKQIYQCDANDLTKLCIRDLAAGEVNGRIGYKPTPR